MNIRHVTQWLLTTMLIVGGVRASAQTISRVALTKASGASSEEFEVVSSAFEVSPGRLIVADVFARRIALIDFERGDARSIGRNGAGPGEFRAVEHFIPRPGGGVFAVDFYNRRLMPILPDGVFGDAIPMPTVSMQVRSSDPAGRLYGDMGIFGGGKISDSARVVRWDPKSGAIDTLFVLDMGRSGMMMRPGESFRPWRNTGKWAPLPNGDVLTLSAADYRFGVRSEGKEIKSVGLPFQRVTVTDEDKATFTRVENAKPTRTLNGNVSTRPGPERTYAFPSTYPPFDADAELLPARDGTFWIARVTSPRDSIARYDVIAPEGRVVAEVTLPPRTQVVALGRDAVYVAEKDRDDVFRVKRYAYPKLP